MKQFSLAGWNYSSVNCAQLKLFDLSLQTDRNAVKSTWPTREIPYVISPDLGRGASDVASLVHVPAHRNVSSYCLCLCNREEEK